ncbi:uncharacterized protein LY79DRAFT_573646 [Colletotrichum navitas]|uniref:enoyl-[acyl-carrier-protein] reductase n=1 Tax=Colletotrichum navitas TaxID=681940 RepID=A0AAD8PJG0_9PEZI|nr:uncharacterized protein LY79DRAFT_573646 [Colletotrichum navitas]KAK1564105.1 hypothetical protein LY79DRAFT_573646 [Colletotrichum navitas]
MAQSVVHVKPGTDSALRLVTHDIPSMDQTPDRVLVKFLAVPVNRVDLLVMDGQYPVKPQFSVEGQPIPGFDGCGVVIESTSSGFATGDLVIILDFGLGTWRTHAILPANALLKVLRDTPPVVASLIRSGTLIAWLLCEEVASLSEGDWVLMSAGTSCVAQFFVQFARQRGLQTAMVVRDRDNIAETTTQLTRLGASVVISESQLAREKAAAIPGKPVLALDSVFGAVGQAMLDSLALGGKYVMVGMLSGSSGALTVTTDLFYKKLTLMAFRGSDVLKRIGAAKTQAIVDMLARQLIDGGLKCPHIKTLQWAQVENNDVATLEQALNESVRDAGSLEVGYQKTIWVVSS